MITTHVKITTIDNFQLSSLILEPAHRSPKAIIQFHAGTVIRKAFYLKFCSYLVDQDFGVVLFDYRGVGESRPKKLKGFEAAISDWGRKDAPAVLNWIKEKYADIPVHLLAHSMGGQILGLMDNWHLFDRIMVVASSSGNWNNFIPSYQKKVKWSSNIFFPIVLPLFGYAPGRFGLGQDWPKGVAQEWWKNARQNSLMANFMKSKFTDTYYDKIDKNITAWFFPDDHMATPKTLANFQRSYPNAKVDAIMMYPHSFQLEKIGHFGLFKENTKGELWEAVVHSLIR